MDTVKITVTVEDDYGTFFHETVQVPREQVVHDSAKPGTEGLKEVATALLEYARTK